MLCMGWLQKQLVPRDAARRTCENCSFPSPHLHSSKIQISLSSTMSKKENKAQYSAISRRKNARAHKANGWEKQVNPKLKRSTVQQQVESSGSVLTLMYTKGKEKPTPCPPYLNLCPGLSLWVMHGKTWKMGCSQEAWENRGLDLTVAVVQGGIVI